MERTQRAALLLELSKHLRPDVAKVVAAFAESSKSSADDAAAVTRLFASFRTKKQREAVKQTAELVAILAALSGAGHDLASLSSYIAQLPPSPAPRVTQSARPSGRQSAKSAKPLATKSNEIDAGIAGRLAADLLEAQRDRDRFPKLHQQLKDAKRVNTATLHQIARIFLNTPEPYSGRKQALDDILRRHHDALRIAGQDQMLDRLKSI